MLPVKLCYEERFCLDFSCYSPPGLETGACAQGYSSSLSLNGLSNDQDGDILRLLMETYNSGK